MDSESLVVAEANHWLLPKRITGCCRSESLVVAEANHWLLPSMIIFIGLIDSKKIPKNRSIALNTERCYSAVLIRQTVV
jgi:hypothetical protein